MKNWWKSWKTTTDAIVIILVWVVKFTGAIEIPTEVATAISVVLTAIGLIFAKDADVSGVQK